jgi:hypothetical protein
LFEIIPGAVRRNILTRQETDDRIENVIKDWLNYASDRDGGRKKRKTAECNQQEPNVPHFTVLSEYFCELHLE